MSISGIKSAGLLIAIPVIAACGRLAEAADLEISVTLLPVRQAIVDGDREKFRAHHWMNDNYAGGIQDFSARHTFRDGTAFSAEGHALIDANDLGTELSVKKDGLGFADLDFSEFRKYFEGTGGAYRRFSALQANENPGDPKAAQLYGRPYKHEASRTRLQKSGSHTSDDDAMRSRSPAGRLASRP